MNDKVHDQSPDEEVSANETDGAIEANPFSAPETPVEAIVPPSMDGFDAIELASLKKCKTGFKLLYMAAMILLATLLLAVVGTFILPSNLAEISWALLFLVVLPLCCLLFIICDGMLMTAPARSNAKKLYQVSFVCLLAVLVMPFVGFDLLGNRGAIIGAGNPLSFIFAMLKGALVMFLITNTLTLVHFSTWCLGTSRLMAFVNEQGNAARALSLLKLLCVLCVLPVLGAFVESGAIKLVIALASLVVFIILSVRVITTCKGGRDAIARILG